MIYRNSELKQIIKFLDANKKDWLSDVQQEGEPFKVQSYSHLLSLADKFFYIRNKKNFIYPKEYKKKYNLK